MSDLRRALDTVGFQVVRGVVGPDDLRALVAGFDRLLALARTLNGTTEVDGTQFVVQADPFRLHRAVWCGGAEPAIAPFGADPRFVGLAVAALGADPVVQILQQAHFKLPGDAVDFAWHQDASNRRYGSEQFQDLDGRGSFVQIALAIDASGPGNGGLRFLPGTQALGFVADPVTGALPPDAIAGRPIEAPELAPGDAVVFGPFVVHGSLPNDSDGPRRTLILGYALPGANRRVYPGCGTGIARTLGP
jgi:ectoine hydroxylase-related dioxygenase (phytanoyl-CoA dioxygenase family)